MGETNQSGTRHVLYLDPNAARARETTRAVETDDTTLYTASSVEDALERLAWPDIDCLVAVHDPERFDGIDAAATICDTHPCLPVVLFSMAGSADVASQAVGTAVDEFVSAESTDAHSELAAAIATASVEGLTDEHETSDPVDPELANVDPERVDELLETGLDRQHLVELLHKSALFDTILESMPVHLFVKDHAARHLYVSSGFHDSVDEFLGQTDPEIGMVADRHARRAYVEDKYVIEEGKPVLDKVEYLPMLDQWNLTSKVPWRGPDGEVVGLIGITRDITERKKRQNEVKRQNERLDRFASMLSHDLRNPVQLAKMRLELALEEDDPTHLDAVDDALDRMDELIEDVLGLARQGHHVANPTPVDLDDVVGVAWASVDAPQATVDTVRSLGTVLGSEGRLRQLLANCFRNAIEHGGATVTVRVGTLPEREGFFVEDDGPGFPPDAEGDLFDAGYTTSDDGTGFGLSIVREIADAHGWNVVATQSPDGGARLEFSGVDRPPSNDHDGAN